MNTQIQQSIDIVNASFPSIFSKEDVVKLLTDLDSKLVPTASSIDKQYLMDKVSKAIDEVIDNLDSLDIVDTGSAEFYLSGNQIQLESVGINEYYLNRTIKDEVMEAISIVYDNNQQ